MNGKYAQVYTHISDLVCQHKPLEFVLVFTTMSSETTDVKS